MKKKITLITSILLIIALAVTFVGCNKDKTEETPTTTEKVSNTEPTTKFEAPEIKDEPTTEATTEETEASAPETTTKKSTYSSNSGSSSGSGSSNSGSSNSSSSSKPASTTKASSSDSGGFVSAGKNEDGNEVYVNPNGVKITIDDDDVGGELPADNWKTDPDVIEAEGVTGR